jgi:muconolactone delta-isomerase
MKRRSLMKFMRILRFKDSFYALSPDKQKEIADTTGQFLEKTAKEGKLKETYFLGNMKGAMAIFDLRSPEDLVHIAYDNPIFPFVDAEVTPLVDVEVVRKVQAKK